MSDENLFCGPDTCLLRTGCIWKCRRVPPTKPAPLDPCKPVAGGPHTFRVPHSPRLYRGGWGSNTAPAPVPRPLRLHLKHSHLFRQIVSEAAHGRSSGLCISPAPWDPGACTAVSPTFLPITPATKRTSPSPPLQICARDIRAYLLLDSQTPDPSKKILQTIAAQ